MLEAAAAAAAPERGSSNSSKEEADLSSGGTGTKTSVTHQCEESKMSNSNSGEESLSQHTPTLITSATSASAGSNVRDVTDVSTEGGVSEGGRGSEGGSEGGRKELKAGGASVSIHAIRLAPISMKEPKEKTQLSLTLSSPYTEDHFDLGSQ